MIVNRIKKLVDQKGISIYRFSKEAGLTRRSATELYNDPTRIPRDDVMDKLGNVYGWQPGDYIYYVPDEVVDILKDNR